MPRGKPINHERIEQYLEMRSLGRSDDQIARAFGIKERSLYQWKRERGIV